MDMELPPPAELERVMELKAGSSRPGGYADGWPPAKGGGRGGGGP